MVLLNMDWLKYFLLKGYHKIIPCQDARVID